MQVFKKAFLMFVLCATCACTPYSSPERHMWSSYLNGASFTDMTEMSRVAKRPVYLGAGGQLVNSKVASTGILEYGDKITNDNIIATQYMADL